MNRTTTHLAGLTLAAAVALTGCTAPTTQEAGPSTAQSTISLPAPNASSEAPAPDTAAKATEEQNALALKTARVMSTWTPGKDENRTASELRARELMTKERAAKVIAPARPATGDEWRRAYQTKATSVPSVELATDEHGSQEGLTVAVTARWTWKTPDGESFPADGYRRYYFTFTDEAPYKIRDYTYEDSTAD